MLLVQRLQLGASAPAYWCGQFGLFLSFECLVANSDCQIISRVYQIIPLILSFSVTFLQECHTQHSASKEKNKDKGHMVLCLPNQIKTKQETKSPTAT